jgi:hypothetical protein
MMFKEELAVELFIKMGGWALIRLLLLTSFCSIEATQEVYRVIVDNFI